MVNKIVVDSTTIEFDAIEHISHAMQNKLEVIEIPNNGADVLTEYAQSSERLQITARFVDGGGTYAHKKYFDFKDAVKFCKLGTLYLDFADGERNWQGSIDGLTGDFPSGVKTVVQCSFTFLIEDKT